MSFESPQNNKEFEGLVNNKLDPDFQKKFEEVKPAIDLFKKTGYTTEQARLNAERRQNQKNEDSEKIKDIRGSMGLDSENEKPQNYTEVRNEKTGRSILFPKEAIIPQPSENSDAKYVEIKNEKNERSILFSKEAIENAKRQNSTEEILKVPNELMNNLKKEEQLLSSIENEIQRTQSHLENLSNPHYIDQVVDSYTNSSVAGSELQFEFDSLSGKLADLKIAEQKTKEAIRAIEQKLEA